MCVRVLCLSAGGRSGYSVCDVRISPLTPVCQLEVWPQHNVQTCKSSSVTTIMQLSILTQRKKKELMKYFEWVIKRACRPLTIRPCQLGVFGETESECRAGGQWGLV